MIKSVNSLSHVKLKLELFMNPIFFLRKKKMHAQKGEQFCKTKLFRFNTRLLNKQITSI